MKTHTDIHTGLTSAQVKENLAQIKQQETERKEPTHNEHWRRRSRSDRQDDPERR
jgi:hypothetical protein